MKKLFFILLLNSFFISNLSARESLDAFMLDICTVADEQLRDEFYAQNPYSLKYQKLGHEVINYEQEIKNLMDKKLDEGIDPPRNMIERIIKIIQNFSNDPQSDLEKLLGQYTAGIKFQENALTSLTPDLNSFGDGFDSDKLKGDLIISITDRRIIFKQKYEVTKLSNNDFVNFVYEYQIIYDRQFQDYDTQVALINATPSDDATLGSQSWPTRNSAQFKKLLSDLGLGAIYGLADASIVKNKNEDYYDELLNHLSQQHHPQCYALLYKKPTLDQQMQKIAFVMLGRGNQVEDKTQVVGGLGSEAHGEGEKDATKGIN